MLEIEAMGRRLRGFLLSWGHDKSKKVCECACVCACVCKERREMENLSGLERQIQREDMSYGKGELLKVQNVVCHMEWHAILMENHVKLPLSFTSCELGLDKLSNRNGDSVPLLSLLHANEKMWPRPSETFDTSFVSSLKKQTTTGRKGRVVVVKYLHARMWEKD